MKIAQIVSTFPPYKGGMGNVAYHFAWSLASFKHQISVLTPLYGNEAAKKQEALLPNLEVRRLKPVFSFGNAAIMSDLFKQLKGAEIIHLHYPFYGCAFLIAAYRRIIDRRCRLLVHYHMDTRAQGWKGLVFKTYRYLLAPWVFRCADAITCASLDYVKHGDMAGFYAKHAAKFVQVPFGVDADKFHPGENQQKQILFVGGLDKAHYFKGLDILLEAFAGLSGPMIDYRLVIVGHGDLLPVYREMAVKLGVAERVDFRDQVNDAQLAEVYRESSFLVLPSINRNEAFGLVLLEAMASGLPVIASNLPGVRSVFRNGQHGYLVRPGDTDDLGKKIWQLAANDQQYQMMRTAARELVLERYTWQKAAERLNELYFRIRFAPEKRS
ncbi:MAG: glycosyltransferase family 4 protein [Candidatus Falkowbacteria bacterium]